MWGGSGWVAVMSGKRYQASGIRNQIGIILALIPDP
jgi:hypothetical protein